MTPNCHHHVAGKGNLGPTFERSRKPRAKRLSSDFRSASHQKQSMNIYLRKSCRTLPKTTDSSMRSSLKGFWSILKRLSVGWISLSYQVRRNIKCSQKNKMLKMQDCEVDHKLTDKNTRTRRENEYIKERNDVWNAQPEGGRQNNIRKVRISETPTLSDLQRSNFRLRLYYQLNVVKRPIENTSYVNSLHLERQEQCPVTRPKGKHYLGIERSKPIPMKIQRISDIDFGNSPSELPKIETMLSDIGSDIEDVFALDI